MVSAMRRLAAERLAKPGWQSAAGRTRLAKCGWQMSDPAESGVCEVGGGFKASTPIAQFVRGFSRWGRAVAEGHRQRRKNSWGFSP